MSLHFKGPLDHADADNPDDTLDLTFGITATDNEGDKTDGAITVTVRDDGPSVATKFAAIR